MSVLAALLFGLLAIRANIASSDTGIPPQAPVTPDNDADVHSEATSRSVTFDGTLLTAVQWSFQFNKAREKYFRGQLGFWDVYAPRVASTFKAIFVNGDRGDTVVFNLTTFPSEFDELVASGLVQWTDVVTGVDSASITGSYMVSYKQYRGDTDSLPTNTKSKLKMFGTGTGVHAQLEAEEKRTHVIIATVLYAFDTAGKLTLATHTLLDAEIVVDDKNAEEENGISLFLFSFLRKNQMTHQSKNGFVGSFWWWTALSAAAVALVAIAYYYHYTYGTAAAAASKKYTRIGYGSAADALLI